MQRSFALRGLHSTRKRFATIFHKLKVHVREFGAEEDLVEGRASQVGAVNVSKVQLRSGFFVGPESQEQQPSRARKLLLYIDNVCIGQRDALICHLVVRESGEAAFKALNGPIANVIDLVFGVPILVIVCVSPWVPYLVYRVIPFVIVHVSRRLLLCSKTMVLLLLSIRQVQLQLFFIVVYFGLLVSVFSSSSLVLLGILFAFTSFGELVKDTTLRKRSLRNMTIIKIMLGLFTLVISFYLIFGLYDDFARHFYVDFRPDTLQARLNLTTIVPYSDGPCVEDLQQQAIDLGLSLGIGHLFNAFYILRLFKEDEMTTVRLPIVPEFVAALDLDVVPFELPMP